MIVARFVVGVTSIAMSEKLAMRDKIAGGCSEEEFLAMRCPDCGSKLIFSVHPRGDAFFFACEKDTVHLSITYESTAPPAWWQKYPKNGWYVDTPLS